jgi:ribosome recycling factor
MSTTQEVLQHAEEHMKKALERLHKELQTVSAQAAPIHNCLDRIEVDYYGTMTPLKGLGKYLHTSDGRSLTIQPYDKGSSQSDRTAIHKSDLGVTPTQTAASSASCIPQMTEDRRKELARWSRKSAKNLRVAVRNISPRQLTKILEKAERCTISEDEIKRKEALQKITDKYVKEIDKISKRQRRLS